MRNESVGFAGGFISVGGIFGAGISGMVTAERHTTRTLLVNQAEQSLAEAKTRLTTVTPTLFGPDSPAELADAIRGAEEALPELKAAARTSRLHLASALAGSVAMVVGGLAIASWGYGER